MTMTTEVKRMPRRRTPLMTQRTVGHFKLASKTWTKMTMNMWKECRKQIPMKPTAGLLVPTLYNLTSILITEIVIKFNLAGSILSRFTHPIRSII